MTYTFCLVGFQLQTARRRACCRLLLLLPPRLTFLSLRLLSLRLLSLRLRSLRLLSARLLSLPHLPLRLTSLSLRLLSLSLLSRPLFLLRLTSLSLRLLSLSLLSLPHLPLRLTSLSLRLLPLPLRLLQRKVRIGRARGSVMWRRRRRQCSPMWPYPRYPVLRLVDRMEACAKVWGGVRGEEEANGISWRLILRPLHPLCTRGQMLTW